MIDKIGELPPITADDLTAIAIAQLTGLRFKRPFALPTGDSAAALIPDISDDLTNAVTQMVEPPREQFVEFRSGMSRFIGFATLEVRINRQGSKRFALGSWVPVILKQTDGEFEPPPDEIENALVDEPHSLWVSRTGLSLEADTQMVRDPLGSVSFTVEAYLDGGCSAAALTIAEEQIGTVLESIAHSARLSATETEKKEGQQSLIAEFKVSDIAVLTPQEQAEDDLQQRERRLAPLTYLITGDGGQIVRTCLDACFGRSDDKNDTFMDRLRNATVLLAHADQMGFDLLSRKPVNAS